MRSGGPHPDPRRVTACARLHSRAELVNPTAAQADLIVRLAALAEAVVELRQAQRHAAQAAAARRAAERLHAEARSRCRRTEPRAATSAGLAAESFPVPPWAARARLAPNRATKEVYRTNSSR